MSRRAFHPLAVLSLAGVLLYGGVSARATEAAATIEAAKAPHIALLLPTDWESFARAAEAVRAGFFDASTKATNAVLPIRLYPVNDNARNVIDAYRQAISGGAQAVVGPLTRSAVTALASAADKVITVKTLALNVPERVPTAGNFYSVSLQLEAEARQVAQLALSEGRRKALTVSEPTPLSRRIREAFAQEFERGGGHHIAEYAYATDSESLDHMKRAAALGVADMVFFAVEGSRVANVRPYLEPIAAYGTSQVNPGSPADDARLAALSNMRFLDMPWMVQPGNPEVVPYARSGGRESDELERLYALGVDAFRLAEKLLDSKDEHIELDGVTGRLTLEPDHQFERHLLLTLIEGGKLVVLGEAGR
jgi:outer membrane PBP1 activator LpoA protein